ncbi:MAG: membrane protein insertase YidC [Alphaproteobacteria bacterium]|nr:membrane protein insertase YidC [Alphaproteobacteria bacterium]
MNNNVFLAVILSLGIWLGFQQIYVKPHQEALRSQYLAQQITPKQAAATAPVEAAQQLLPRAELIKASPRVAIETPELAGSIDLKGARFDDLSLTQYHETEDKNSPAIILLSPSGSAPPQRAYYAEFSWLSDAASVAMPSSDTLWKSDSQKLTPDHSVRLSWNNGQGLTFDRTIAVDDQAMFTITDRISNSGNAPIVLYPFGTVARQGVPPVIGRSVVHEGALGVLGGTLEEYKYKKLIDDKKIAEESTGGWLGITDKYWLVAMIPPQSDKLTAEFAYNRAGAVDPTDGFFQSDFRGSPVTVPAGGNIEHVDRLFAGAKKVKLLDHYAEQYNIPHFDKAIDFGLYYFLARPFLYLLTMLANAVGNMGVAILLFTVLLKLVTLPLSLKSYHSMSRMKALQPEMKRIQERFADDKVRQSQEMMELYKREKVSPVSGCVPTLIQIPIFFALYKVLYVNIEMRGAPFFGWIHDMSVADPTSVFNLFGLLPYPLPAALHIGAWPILMGCGMFLQQKMSPTPPDKSQARMFMFMPILFTWMLARMPAGLVIYWTWSNLLGIAQQWYIMRKDAKRKAAA